MERVMAGCYARKSNQERGKDEDAKSVTRQVARAREYATRKGWTFDDRCVFRDDGISGAEFKKRPGLTALLDAVKQKRMNVLVVSEQSRLGRDTVRTLSLIQAIEDANVQVWAYLDDSRITLAEDVDEVREFMRSWAASQERRKAGQRTKDAMRRLAEAGKSTGGPRAYGYTSKGHKIVPSEAAIVRRVFKHRSQGLGYYKIARDLEHDGIPAPKGGDHWHHSQVAKILTNERYAGVKVYSDLRTSVAALRIVSDALWQKAQAMNQQAGDRTWQGSDGKLKSRPTASKHLLSPFLACGVCKGAMHVKVNNGTPMYVCTNRHLLGKAKCSNARGLKVDHANKTLVDTFEEVLVGHLVRERFEMLMSAAPPEDAEAIQQERDTLKKQIARLVDSLAKGELSEIHTAVRERRDRLARLDTQNGSLAAFDRDTFLRDLEPLLRDWRTHLRKNPTTAQQVLRKILPERLAVMPTPDGGWTFKGMTNYRKVLEELGLTPASLDALLSKASLTGCP